MAGSRSSRWRASPPAISRPIWITIDLPRHPLVAEGYRSIGCVPCTVKGGTSDNPRAGRWAGQSKDECGIHWTVNGQPVRLAKAG